MTPALVPTAITEIVMGMPSRLTVVANSKSRLIVAITTYNTRNHKSLAKNGAITEQVESSAVSDDQRVEDKETQMQLTIIHCYQNCCQKQSH